MNGGSNGTGSAAATRKTNKGLKGGSKRDLDLKNMTKDQRETAAFIKEIFNSIDEDGSGELDKREVGVLLEELGEKVHGHFGHGSKKLNQAFKEMDPSGDGAVDYIEFLAWYKRRHPQSVDDVMEMNRWMFQQLDEDGSGELDKSEVAKLAAMMGEKLTGHFSGTKKLDEAFAEMDPSGDGAVTFDEFQAWHREHHPKVYERFAQEKVEDKSMKALRRSMKRRELRALKEDQKRNARLKAKHDKKGFKEEKELNPIDALGSSTHTHTPYRYPAGNHTKARVSIHVLLIFSLNLSTHVPYMHLCIRALLSAAS